MTAALLSATSNHAKCPRSSLHKSHPTPDVVFLKVNINIRTAVPKATNSKNLSNLGAIFSAARAARVAIFGGCVVLEKFYRVSKNFPYYYFRFLMIIPF